MTLENPKLLTPFQGGGGVEVSWALGFAKSKQHCLRKYQLTKFNVTGKCI